MSILERETRRLRTLDRIQSWITRPLELQPTTINPDGSPKKLKDLLDSENFYTNDLLAKAERWEKNHIVLWKSWDIGGKATFADGVSLTTGEEITVEAEEI